MAVSIEGVLVLVAFYVFVMLTGILASWGHRKHHPHDNAMETSLVAGRSLRGVVSVFTMMGEMSISFVLFTFTVSLSLAQLTFTVPLLVAHLLLQCHCY